MCERFIIISIADKLVSGEVGEFEVVGLEGGKVVKVRYHRIRKGDGVSASTATLRCWCRGKEVKKGLVGSLVVTVGFGLIVVLRIVVGGLVVAIVRIHG